MLKSDASEDELIVVDVNVEMVSVPWAVGYVKKLLFAVASVK